MAYIATPSSHRRTLTIGAVATLHLALGYALVTGFAATVWDKVDVLMPTKSWKEVPPPEPEPTTQPKPAIDETRIFTPKPLVDLTPKDNATTVIDLLPMPQPSAISGSADPGPVVPSASPSASFTPRAATPIGSPGKWATTDDYPAAALREERAGVARFRVTIGADGRVRNCEILGSSGSADLDRATCANVAKRARFKPATDDTGSVVSGSYTSAVKWEIPG